MARKKGKYADIIDQLPKYQGEDPSQDAKVNVVRAAIFEEVKAETGMPPSSSELVERFLSVKAEKEALEDEIKPLDLELEALTRMVWDQFEVEGITRMDLSDGTGLRLQEEPYPKVEDPEKFYRWCVEQGLTSKLSMHYQTLKAVTTELVQAHQAEPDGVTLFKKPKLVRTN